MKGSARGGVPNTKSKAKSWIHKAVRETCEAGSKRQPSSHLSLRFLSMRRRILKDFPYHCTHHSVAKKAHERIPDEH